MKRTKYKFYTRVRSSNRLHRKLLCCLFLAFYKIQVGPSSSHTNGPMIAGFNFTQN
ncbi:hypothetical protein O9992_26400 [Vibrio lentus]|nr:hypothetical protein [Vibrio lentus]